MLLEVKNKLREKLKEHLMNNSLSIYKCRKEGIKFNGIHINTVDDIIKDRPRNIHNNTIISLLTFLRISYDVEFYQDNNIIKLYEENDSKELPESI